MNVVGYVRLSRDEDRENYSSINTQQDIISEYAIKRNWIVSKMYIDDNFSGYTLNRPAFKEMLRELENGNIDVIVAKDLSRVGRNNGQVLVLIDRFKEMGKRLILVSEGNNGYDILDDNDDILGIKTWYNEMYVKDISRKIRANMNLKQKKGELIMGNHYGYRKIKNNDKFELAADEEIRPVIELIFNSYINGLGYKRTCDILSEKQYPTPSEYVQKRHEDKGRAFKNAVTSKWQTHMIQRIIKDDIYIGVLRTKKRHSKLIKGKQERVPKDEQYVFENHHEPMISKDIFDLAQQINQKKKIVNYRGSSKYNYIFSGFVVCGDCGFAAGGKNIKKKPNVQMGYDCLMYQKYGLKYCSSHSVSEEKLLFYFKEFLKDIKEKYKSYLESLNFKEKKKDINRNLNKIIKDLSVLNDELKLLYNQKIKDILKETNIEYRQIIENSYTELENEKKKQISIFTKKAEELQQISNNDIEKNIKTAIEVFDDIINCETPNRKMLEMILEKIIIYKDRTVEFKLLVSIAKLTYNNF
jgi:site-specific DNA recombinase